MGLDLVELVMEIEDAFSLKFPDDQASQMYTVGDVYEFILANTTVPPTTTVCLSAVTFYRLRRAAKILGRNERVRPRDSVENLLPSRQRQPFWHNLGREAHLKLPPLRRPPWLVTLCTGVVVLITLLVGLLANLSGSNPLVVLCALGAMAVTATSLGMLCAWLTRPFAVYPAAGIRTLRDLAETAMGLNFDALNDEYRGARGSDVWIALRAIIVEQLGVSPEQVTPTASWVNDLGCG